MTTPDIETDERRGLPSASGMQRIMDCPASLPLTELLRQNGQLPADHGSADADRGTRIHAILDALANDQPLPESEPDELAEARELWETVQTIVTRSFGVNPAGVEIITEKRLWLLDEFDSPIASCRFDFLAAVQPEQGRALLLDYKTGRSFIPAPRENWQMLTGAVLVRNEYGVPEITAGVVQSNREPMVDVFSAEVLELADARIRYAVSRRHIDPFTVPFHASPDNCKYCPARLACPKLHMDHAIARMLPDPEVFIATAPTHRLGEFLVAAESAKTLFKAAEKEMAFRLTSGQEDANWHMASGPARRKITDAAAMGKALIAEGATVDTVLAAMSLNVGAAEAVLKDATKLKGKALAARMAEIGADYIVAPEPEPSLKRR